MTLPYGGAARQITVDLDPAAASVLQKIVVEPHVETNLGALEKTAWVADGNATHPRRVRPHGSELPLLSRSWQAARRWVQSGKVQLRHIMVGVIREDSANKAAAILTGHLHAR